MKPPAVVLLSGGLDSAVTFAAAKKDGFRPHALTVDYGQRHLVEIESARRVASALGAAEHIVISVPLHIWGGSALTGQGAVPKRGPGDEKPADEIPATYVPARNTVLLSLALAWAETLGATDIYIGVNSIDYSGYPDCRPEYIEAFERMARLATKASVAQGKTLRIHTPLISLAKAEIITLGAELGVDFSLTHSCYDPDESGRPCGLCDSCAIRLKGFRDAGLADPVEYQAGSK